MGLLIHEKELEDIAIVDPCEVNITDFFYINEGKWDINHHFKNDPIYDEVEVGLSFL